MRTGGVSWGVLALGGLAAFLLLRPRPTASPSNPSPTPAPVTCRYLPGSGLSKSYEELIYRIHERIREVRPNLGTCIPASGTPCTMVLASVLATAPRYGVPPDIATALAWRESRFGLYLETDRIRAALAKGRCTSAAGTEIGPLQVKPAAFCQVQMDPQRLLSMDMTGRIWYAVGAGLAYLEWLKSQFPGASWQDLLQAYNVGPTAFRHGKRNPEYACAVINRANLYTELKV
ncbi:transglycosylase SLT domain-containing protein [Thermus sp. SYSU G05001]|uniref:Transglycosylase SLT domain-containing protein n=1 Tax=Thermus brevis TaxID=2862456 RepID=A0ABS7A265_9DEIN|nr:transglycosylase SLT domain-containing protein [Thermus brevis]MBW6395837.1 transglycosylase SLT domain-containing protein [Thermus brevis]